MKFRFSTNHTVTHENIIVGSYWIKYSTGHTKFDNLYKVVAVNHKYATLKRISRRLVDYLGKYYYDEEVPVADINEPLEILLQRFEYVSRAEILIHW